jgi:hypothetical protein
LVIVAAIAFVVTPFFADPFTGFDPALFPVPVDDPPIQPAGWAFAIWGVIYLWLLVSAGFGLFKRDIDPDWDRLRWPLFVSVAIGASWISVALIAPVWRRPDLGDADRRASRTAPAPDARLAVARPAAGPLRGLADGGLLRGAGHRRGGLWPRQYVHAQLGRRRPGALQNLHRLSR